jgi:hypothetical protein
MKNNIQTKSAKRLAQSFGSSIACSTVMYNTEMLPNFRFADDYTINMDWDLEIFGRLWPKAIAAILARLHSRSYSSNEG